MVDHELEAIKKMRANRLEIERLHNENQQLEKVLPKGWRNEPITTLTKKQKERTKRITTLIGDIWDLGTELDIKHRLGEDIDPDEIKRLNQLRAEKERLIKEQWEEDKKEIHAVNQDKEKTI